MILKPCSCISLAAWYPALPYPWTATRRPDFSIPSFSSVDSTLNIRPRAVAVPRPSEPPMGTGLPVTTPGTVYPLVML